MDGETQTVKLFTEMHTVIVLRTQLNLHEISTEINLDS